CRISSQVTSTGIEPSTCWCSSTLGRLRMRSSRSDMRDYRLAPGVHRRRRHRIRRSPRGGADSSVGGRCCGIMTSSPPLGGLMPFEVALIVIAALAAAAAEGATARSADGVAIRYHVEGTGEPTVVLVHGWAMDRHVWDGQAPALAKRHRVVTLDLAGHGESGGSRPAWTKAAFGEDVKAVVEAVGLTQLVLVGHSMGGPVVLEAARRMPERVKGIVLVDTLLDVEERTPAAEVEAFARQLEADYKTVVAQMSGNYLFAAATPAAVRERVLGQAM